jgi:hypothetical protein
MKIQRPRETEFAPFYAGYVSLVPEGEVLGVLEAQPGEVSRLAASVPQTRETHRYAAGKWSIREVLGHITDGERVFGYRAFCISRGDQTSLPAFDEGEYVKTSRFDTRSLGELARDFAAIREANLTVLRRLPEADWERAGTANAKRVSVRALAYIMAGHVRHHLGILRDRYGVGPAA